MDGAVSTSTVEYKVTIASTAVGQGPGREAQAGSSAGADGSAVRNEAAVEEGRHVYKMEEAEGYLPTPSPAPSSTSARPSATDARALQDLDQDLDDESVADSLSSADTDMADAATVPQSRKTVLFPDLSTTFPSSELFFDACRNGLLDAYGTSIERYWSSELSATVKCARRLDSSCPFTVRVVVEGGVWGLEEVSCVWEHSHGPAGSSTAASESENGSDSAGEEDDWEADSDEEVVDRGRLGIVVGSVSGPWAAKTGSALVRRLVDSRDDIFNKQRSCQQRADSRAAAVLVADSQRAVDKFIEQSAKAGQSLPRSSFGNYKRFCDAQGVPVFPMTPAILALWLVHKCSAHGEGYFKTYKRLLIKIMHVAAPGWAASSVYRSLLALDPECEAVKDFLLERKPTGPTTKPDELPPQPVPGLPQPGDSFSSAQEVYGAFVRAVLPVLGIGLAKSASSSTTSMIIKCNRSRLKRAPPGSRSCPYRVEVEVDERTGRWVVAEGADEARHSHGPAAQLVRNPSWRPRVRGADARAALGMSQLPNARKLTRKGGKIKSRGSGPERPQSRSKVSTPFSSFPRHLEQALTLTIRVQNLKSSTSTSKKQRVVGPERSPGGHGRGQGRFGHASSPQHYDLTPLASPTPHYSLDAAPPPAAGCSTAYPPRPPSFSAVLEIQAFLVGLHLSLGPLAPHLIAAGIDTTGALVDLAAMDPAFLDLALDLARIRLPAAGTASTYGAALPPISIIQRKLFMKLLKEQCATFRSPSGGGS
ncbi:hypothetical protein JCM9279_007488 [Rhodotorula babjevae]